MTTVIGIDPGLDGGIAVLEQGSAPPYAVIMPTLGSSKRELDEEAIRDMLQQYRNAVVWVEVQQAMPKQGVSSTGVTMGNYGFIRGLVRGMHMPLYLVRPQAWQKQMLGGVRFAAEDTKAASALVAARLWPSVDWRKSPRAKKAHDGKTDAALIAAYGMREMMRIGLLEVAV